jgi:hypothetical protein
MYLSLNIVQYFPHSLTKLSNFCIIGPANCKVTNVLGALEVKEQCRKHVVEEEELVFQLCHHSDKVAIALGLINIAPTSPLQIKKICRFFKIATLPSRSPQKY